MVVNNGKHVQLKEETLVFVVSKSQFCENKPVASDLAAQTSKGGKTLTAKKKVVIVGWKITRKR